MFAIGPRFHPYSDKISLQAIASAQCGRSMFLPTQYIRRCSVLLHNAKPVKQLVNSCKGESAPQCSAGNPGVSPMLLAKGGHGFRTRFSIFCASGHLPASKFSDNDFYHDRYPDIFGSPSL